MPWLPLYLQLLKYRSPLSSRRPNSLHTLRKLFHQQTVPVRPIILGVVTYKAFVAVDATEELSEDDAIATDDDTTLCLDFEVEKRTESLPLPDYETFFITTHKGPVTAASFSHNGLFVATGSVDSSIKVVDVNKMKQKTDESRPVIRNYYDHMKTITQVQFHPNDRMLASSSLDGYIKLYDLTKVGAKKSFRYLGDKFPVRSISFHPSGDYLLAGSDSEVVRMHDIKTFQCYKPADETNQHRGAINEVCYAPNGTFFASCSTDGSVKIWDGVNFRCTRTIEAAHGGTEVYSAKISRNGKYLLTAGRDSIPRLWDLSSGRLQSIRCKL